MNRNDEWLLFVEEVKKYAPSQIEDSAQRAIARKEKTNVSLLLSIPLFGILVAFVVFVTLKNLGRTKLLPAVAAKEA